MREFAKVSPCIWRSRKLKSLGDDDAARLLYFYFLTSPHSNSAGCYALPVGYGSADIGWQADSYRKAMDRLSKAGLIAFDDEEETLFITNWATFNPPTNPKHALGILDQLRRVASGPLKTRAAQAFSDVIDERSGAKDSKVMAVIQGLLKDYREPGDTPETTDPRPRPDLIQTTERPESRGRSREAARAAAPPGGAARAAAAAHATQPAPSPQLRALLKKQETPYR